MKYVIGLIVVVAIGAGIGAYYYVQKSSPAQPSIQLQPPPPQASAPPTQTMKRDLGMRVFNLKGKSGSVSGDGNMVFKGGQATVGIKMTGLADLTANQWYEVFFEKSGTYQSVGKLTKTGNSYVLGSQGPEMWFDYTKVVVSKESKDDRKPDQVVAEADFEKPVAQE